LFAKKCRKYVTVNGCRYFLEASCSPLL
jgi:hypothetical protein